MKLNDLDLNKLHVFRVVAESASMREAGDRLLRTPSAISQSVAGLERSLGVQLFVRAGVKLELTDAGQKILQQVKVSEQGLQALLDEVRGAPSRVRGLVNLGLPPGYPACSLSKELSEVLSRHSELQLRLRFQSHAELAQGLVKNHLDLAISLQPLEQWDRRIKSFKLREENLILVVPARKRYLWSDNASEVPIVDYFQKPMLIEGWLKHHWQNAQIGQKKLRTRVRVFAANFEHVLQLVQSGVGCAVVPRHAVASELELGSLIEHAFDKRNPWLSSVWMNSIIDRERQLPGALEFWGALEVT